jgi:hypothetical protein
VTPDWFASAAKSQVFAQRASENQRDNVNQRTYKSDNLFFKINAIARSDGPTNLMVFFEKSTSQTETINI